MEHIMTNDRTILITGVTGNQGGAVAQALQGVGFHLRGLTRKPDSARAAARARQGVEVVKGDLNDDAAFMSGQAIVVDAVSIASVKERRSNGIK
jgi:uncharacterized protein YbjT (DUF2867 family)